MCKWLFHSGANFIEKQKLLRKLYEPTLKIYTDEMSMIRQNTNRDDYFPIMRIERSEIHGMNSMW
jgi:hypothetical protein